MTIKEKAVEEKAEELIYKYEDKAIQVVLDIYNSQPYKTCNKELCEHTLYEGRDFWEDVFKYINNEKR